MFRLLALLFISHSFAAIAANSPMPLQLQQLRVAIFLEPPFSDKQNNEYIGEYPDIARLMAQAVNLPIHWIECPVARCLALLQTGDADMLIGVKQTKPREQYLTFLQPAYFMQQIPINFFSHKTQEVVINRYSDLQDLAIGVLRGSSYFEPFDHDTSLNKVAVTNTEQLIKMLVKHRIDTFIEREESLLALPSYQQYKQQIEINNFQIKLSMATFIAISKNTAIASYQPLFERKLKQYLADGTIEKLIIHSENP